MAITDRTYVERVVIVLNSDGTLKGAHQESLREIKDGATLISATILPAVPLDTNTLAGILPNQGALAAQVQSLTDALAAMTAERDAAVAANAASAPDVVNGVPQSVTPYQARVALRRVGMLDAVEAAVRAADGEAAIAWDYATVFLRQSPFIVGLSASVGLSEAQIDQLFIAAAQVT